MLIGYADCSCFSVWRTVFQSTWSTFRTRFSEPIENFKRHRRLLENHASLAFFEEIKAVRDKQAESFRFLREDAKRQQQERVRTWLAHEDMMSDQDHHVEIRQDYPGTGKWILKKRIIKAWLDLEAKSENIVWLTGIPGAGKTTLASIIIEEACTKADAQVIFFYCKDGNHNRDNFLSIATSLDHLTEYLDAEMSKSGETTLKRAVFAKELLTTAARSKGKLFVVIDGIDECLKTQKKEIVSWFRSLATSEADVGQNDMDSIDEVNEIRCLLIGQEDIECSKLLKDYPTFKIQAADNSDDIKAFCQQWESKIIVKHPSADIPKGSITAKVSEYSDGKLCNMFSKDINLTDSRHVSFREAYRDQSLRSDQSF